MSLKDECAKAGQRMGARLRLLGDTMTLQMNQEEKIAFWSAILDEINDVFDELLPDDVHGMTKH